MFWDSIREGIRGHFDTDPIGTFMTWPQIASTMVVKVPRYIIPAETYLKPDWGRWSKVVEPELTGYTNENLINQAYHLARWENEAGMHVWELDRIVEIGGGYGAMAVVARRAGFTGKYVIYDFPELNKIQDYYLKAMGIEANLNTEFSGDDTDLLIGLFSLSEMSPSIQCGYLDQIRTKHVLIAALNAPWEGYNSLPDLEARFPDARRLPIEHMDGRVYLFD